MCSSHTDSAAPMQRDDPIAHGIRLGIRAGGIAGGTYLLLYCVLLIVLCVPDIWRTQSSAPLLTCVALLPPIVAVGAVIVGIPVIGIGVLTGLLIAIGQHFLVRRLTLARARVLGGGTCGLIALLLHVGWWNIFGTLSGMFSIMVLRIPTVIYVGLGLWLSGHLFQQTALQYPLLRSMEQ